MEQQLKPNELNPYFEKIIYSYIKIISTTLRPWSVTSYFYSLKNFFQYLIKYHPEIVNLSELKRSPHIEGWLSNLASKKMTNGTKITRIMNIRKFLHDMYEWGWEDAPQPELITCKDFPKQDEYLPRPIATEMDKILKEYLRTQNTLMAQALLLLRKTGMRIGELRDLEKDCLEKVSDGKYTLHVPIGKLHKDRIIPVDEETVEIVNCILNLRGSPQTLLSNPRTGKPTQFLLIQNNSKRPSYAGLRDNLINLSIRSGIPEKITPHRFRHTYASELLRGGINLAVLMTLLGHKDLRMTLRYAAVTEPLIQQSYYAALEKSQTLYLLPKSENTTLQNVNEISNPDYILNVINNLIIKINSFGKDSTEPIYKKRIHRITERLRKIYYLVEDILIIH
jgi:site-specific recombinase XerD